MSKDNLKKIQGIVTRIERTCYFVRFDEIAGSPEVKAYIGGNMRNKRISIVIGDSVSCEMDMQYPEIVRIVYRGVNKHAAGATATTPDVKKK